MANNFVNHVDKWLLLSESETDFAVMFIRAWIPFNAWYCNAYPNNLNNDRRCIDEIKIDGNQFRAKLRALLEGNFTEAVTFRQHLGHLHNLLEQHPIPEADINKRVTFKNIYFRENVVPPINISRSRIIYKAERLSNNSVTALIINTRSTIHSYTYSKYDLAHFMTDLTNNSLPTNEQRANIISIFKEINPRKPENLISSSRSNSINANGVYFINDANLLSQGIIELLYSLRCKLFHGELQPSKDNLSVYEPCYYMLRILLKSLI